MQWKQGRNTSLCVLFFRLAEENIKEYIVFFQNYFQTSRININPQNFFQCEGTGEKNIRFRTLHETSFTDYS